MARMIAFAYRPAATAERVKGPWRVPCGRKNPRWL